MKAATIRDLRTRFPYVRKLVEEDGEVMVTERGRPVIILRLYEEHRRRPAPVDYYRRLKSRMPRAVTASVRRALDEADRAER